MLYSHRINIPWSLREVCCFITNCTLAKVGIEGYSSGLFKKKLIYVCRWLNKKYLLGHLENLQFGLIEHLGHGSIIINKKIINYKYGKNVINQQNFPPSVNSLVKRAICPTQDAHLSVE